MLAISRDDVSSTEITNFTKEERFIKLPIEKYLGMLNIEANGPQMAMINAINNPKYRFITGALSRRIGKTTVANIIGQLVTLVPKSNVLIMSPNYSLSNISFEEQRKLIRVFDIEVEKDNSKDRIIELSNHSTIRMGSVSQVDSCVGRSYDLIIFDEAALTDDGEDAFSVALRPTLDKPGSKCIFISTPRGKNNWFAKYFYRGFSPDFPAWVSVHADWRENPRVSEEDIKEARKAVTKAQFEQEYEASFTSFEGQIYKFDTDSQVQNLSELDISKMDTIIGLDIGFKDATVAIVFGYDYETECWYALDEYYETEKTTGHHATAILMLEEKYNVQAIFIDSSAQQTRYDWAYGYNLATLNANKSVLDGIAYCQTIVENNRLVVDPKCENLLAALDQYRWDEGSNLIKERPKHDDYSHAADALRYALYSYTTGISSV
jgi:phage terminase large subunit